jgi:hypothetical protein
MQNFVQRSNYTPALLVYKDSLQDDEVVRHTCWRRRLFSQHEAWAWFLSEHSIHCAQTNSTIALPMIFRRYPTLVVASRIVRHSLLGKAPEW